MHAVMRSIGAELRYAQRSSGGDPLIASYRYRLDVNRIEMTRLLSRWAQIVIRFEVSTASGSSTTLKEVIALMPEMFAPGSPGWKKPPQERPCPPSPSDAPTTEERIYGHNFAAEPNARMTGQPP